MRFMFDIEKLKEIFKNYPSIATAYLFGSYVSGRISSMSDVDIAVLLKEPYPKGRYLIHQMDYLAVKIGEVLKKEVDIVEMNGQGLIFQHNVLRTGKLIYDAEPTFRTNYVSRLISAYCDFEPTLRFMNNYYFDGYKRRLARL